MTQRQSIGFLGGVSISLIGVGPAEAVADLSIACMFGHEKRGNLTCGILHLDQSLAGELTSLRDEGVFRGRIGETLPLTDLPARTAAKAILIVGLGDPEFFSADVIEDAIATAAQQVLRMGVQSAAFSPNLLDAGFIPDELTGIEAALLAGLHTAFRVERRLTELGYRPPALLEGWFFEAGKEHFDPIVACFEDELQRLSKDL